MKGLISGDEKDIEFTVKRMREIENDLSQNDRSNSYLLNRDEIGFADIILSPILIRNIFPMQENCNNCKELKLKDYPHIAKYVDTILEHPKIGEGFIPKWGFINFLMNKRKDPSISLPYPFDETTFEESQSNKEIIIKDGLTAKPLLNSNYIRLYGHPLCPYVQRAILVLAAKKVEYQFVGIDLTAKNDWHCQINGGFVSILETPDGVIVTESLQICDWIEAEFGNQGISLYPEEMPDSKYLPKAFSEGSTLEQTPKNVLKELVKEWFEKVFMFIKIMVNKEFRDNGVQEYLSALEWAEQHLPDDPERPFIGGFSQETMADLMVLPFFRDAFAIEHTELKEKYFDKVDFSALPKLMNWYSLLEDKYRVELADNRAFAELTKKNIEANGPKVQLFYPLF
ncbi:unnamed protein product [Moneuplotes crassus]|uniref:GST C-terminal domain-containing protein n=1 Tax=Euplotes crassus TaxID=5936 RepID=A0AAD1UBN2_EUPCR|nr:unnamed protein product [Moneuplotes crassus]